MDTYSVHLEAEDLATAPLWARKLHHNLQALLASQAALADRVTALERQLAMSSDKAPRES